MGKNYYVETYYDKSIGRHTVFEPSIDHCAKRQDIDEKTYA